MCMDTNRYYAEYSEILVLENVVGMQSFLRSHPSIQVSWTQGKPEKYFFRPTTDTIDSSPNLRNTSPEGGGESSSSTTTTTTAATSTTTTTTTTTVVVEVAVVQCSVVVVVVEEVKVVVVVVIAVIVALVVIINNADMYVGMDTKPTVS